jgi:hypothetical protein
MTRLRRRPRTVYRVYGEEEYLAGADALPLREDAPASRECPSREPAPGRRLQRIAGAAALTGAVGTVGGVLALAELRAHEPAHMLDRRELARRIAPPARRASSRAHAHAHTPARLTRRRISHPFASPRAREDGARSVRLSHRPPSPAGAGARRTVVASTPYAGSVRVASAVPDVSTETASATSGAPAQAPSAARQSQPGAGEARTAAQSEFGFER